MNNNKLAIVVPYYKLTYFEDVLQSLLKQTDSRYNLYIGNDCSPENPDFLIKKYSNIISNYKKFDTNIGGQQLTKQWERCIDELIQNEEWIMLLCDDDILDNNAVCEFYNLIDNKPINENVIKYATRIVNEDNSQILSEHTNNDYENSLEYLTQKILNRKRSTLSEHIFKSETYRKIRFKEFELAFGSDDVAWVDFTNGENYICINNAFVNYRKSVLSISNNQDNILKSRKIKGIIDSYTYILKNYYKKMSPYQRKVVCKRVYQYNRSLYTNKLLDQLKYIFKMFTFVGFKETVNIVRTNKSYYENPD